MNKVTQSVIDSLTTKKAGTVLSLYMPTHKISTPDTAKEDRVRYRNILGKGFEEWQEKLGADAVDITSDIRKQLEAKIEDADFWSETCKGLAIFIQPDGFEVLHLPIECDEYTYVGEGFDLAPLYIVMSMEQPYYVLALAKHNPKLFYGDMYTLEPVEMDFPTSPEDALNIDEMFSGSDTVRGVPTGHGGNDMFSTHGQGDTNHAGQEEHFSYLRILDNKILKNDEIDRDIPLLIASTGSEASDFRHISNHPRLLQCNVQGNHEDTPLHELHDLSWSKITEEIVDKRTAALLERFNEDKGRQKASSDISEVIDATANGKVDTLLLGIVEKTNDSVSDTGEHAAPLIRLQKEYQLNRMCELTQQVIAQGGTIVGVDPELLGTPTMIGACYRY